MFIDCENFLKCFSINSRICSRVSMNKGDNTLIMDFHMNSMGFKSGEYGGKNTRSILSFSAFLWLILNDMIGSYQG
jgi:hypothetical protein